MPLKSNVIPMAIIAVLFFIFGFVTWLNGSLIPYLKILCDLGSTQALLVTFAFYIAYTVLALPMAAVIRRTGYKRGMAIGLVVMAVAALVFIPAALTKSFPLFLGALFMLGAGLTLLQTASNPYVVHLGPIESAAMRISIMGIINKAAGVLAPLLFTALVVSGLQEVTATATPTAEQVDQLAHRLIPPYLAMAAMLTLLATFVRFAPLPELTLQGETVADEAEKIIHHPHLILGSVTLFFYVGIEVIAGDTIGLFGQSLQVPDATSLTAYTMVFMVLGYGVGVLAIPRWISQERALLVTALIGMLFTLGILSSSSSSMELSSTLWGFTGIALLPDPVTFVALLGFANALVWPAVWPLALRGLGPLTAKGSALLIMGIAGGALLPPLFGIIADLTGSMQHAYAIGLVCYAVIVYYAGWGHEKREW